MKLKEFGGTKFKNYLLGLFFAIITLALFTFVFYIVQSPEAPLESAFKYIKESNYDDFNYGVFFVNINSEDKEYYFVLDFAGEFDSVMFEPTFMRDVEIYLTDKYSKRVDGLVLHDSSGRMLIDLRGIEDNYLLNVVVKKGGQLILEKRPLVGDYHYLRFFSKFCYLFSNEFTLLISGMSFLLAFILFSISRVNCELRRTFLAISMATLFYGILFLISAVVLNGENYLAGAKPDIIPALLNTYKISSLLSMFFTVILFSGVEMYITKKYSMTKILLSVNIIGYLLIIFNIPSVDFIISFLNFAFFTIIAYRSGYMFFSFLSFVRPLGELQSYISHRLFHLYDFDMNHISFFILLFGFGAFFIMDYNKKQKELNIINEELVSSNEEIIAMNEEIESSYLEIESLNNDLELKIEQRTKQLQTSMKSISTLLNNTDEGFLKFGSSLLIDPEYSQECLMLFNKKIEYNYFPALICSSQPDQIAFLSEALTKIFNERDEQKREIMFSLLPHRVEREKRVLSVKYRMVVEEEKNIIVIIKDISEEVKLRDQLQNEKEIFEEIVKLMANSESFIELREDYFDFWEKRGFELLKTENSNMEIYRQIHTLKGNFASFGFENLVKNLHELETLFAEDSNELYHIMFSLIEEGQYQEWFNAEMKEIYKYISPNVFDKQMDMREKNEIIARIKDLLKKTPTPQELEQVRELIHEYEKSPFGEVFEPTKNFIMSTAKRLGKNIKRIEVHGSEILVNKQRLKPLLKTWIHIFRNIIDHGLEDADTRVKLGKDPYGSIKINLVVQGKNLALEISDDGKGLDFRSITDKAIKQGIVDRKTMKQNPEKVYEIIFLEGFSTKNKASRLSGRGIGLSSVKKAVESISGEISVESIKNRGTTFRIVVPL